MATMEEQAKAGNAIYAAIEAYWEVFSIMDYEEIKSDILEMLGEVEAEREARI